MSPSFPTKMLLLTLFLFGTVFLVPFDNYYGYFFPFAKPFWPSHAGILISIKSYLYYLFDDLWKLVAAIVIYKETKLPEVITCWLVVLMGLRVVDYMLNYNQVWWKPTISVPFTCETFNLTISCNTVSCLIFAIAILKSEVSWIKMQ